ncbi:MAG: hypothetical protein ACLFPA_04260 [Dichotomicrobium sp.]
MRYVPFIAALVLVLGLALPGADKANAASAIAAPSQSFGLDKQIADIQRSHIQKAGVRFRLYIGPRRRYYRRRYLRRRYHRRRRYGRCGYWSRRCANNWGYRTSSYYGCMRYHGCR